MSGTTAFNNAMEQYNAQLNYMAAQANLDAANRMNMLSSGSSSSSSSTKNTTTVEYFDINTDDTIVGVGISDGNPLRNYGDDVWIIGGSNGDTIITSDTSNVLIFGYESKDSLIIEGEKSIAWGGIGNDDIAIWGDSNIAYGGNGNDFIGTKKPNRVISSRSENTLIGGKGNDTIDFSAEDSLNVAYGGEGDDYISYQKGYNSISNRSSDTIGNSLNTLVGGTGNDTIILHPKDENITILYREGDGDDYIKNFGSTNELLVSESYSTVKSDDDLIVKVGNGQITIAGGASISSSQIKVNASAVNTICNNLETMTSGLDEIENYLSNAISNTNKSASTTEDYSTEQSTENESVESSSYTTSTNTSTSNSSNSNSTTNTSTIANTNPSTSTSTIASNNIINKVNNIYAYSGGNKVISNYQQGEVVNLDDYQGIDLNSSSFFINSSSGQLEIKNSRNKFIGYSADNRNVIAYSYVASRSGNIDGRTKSQAEIMIGADNANNQIFAGSGGSSLWGGNGGNDTLIGGAGYDEFFFAMGSGNDVVQNASDNDVVNLLGVSLSQISSFSYDSSSVDLNFNDGGHLKVESTSSVGYRVENQTFFFNRATNEWANK